MTLTMSEQLKAIYGPQEEREARYRLAVAEWLAKLPPEKGKPHMVGDKVFLVLLPNAEWPEAACQPPHCFNGVVSVPNYVLDDEDARSFHDGKMMFVELDNDTYDVMSCTGRFGLWEVQSDNLGACFFVTKAVSIEEMSDEEKLELVERWNEESMMLIREDDPIADLWLKTRGL